MSTFTLITPVLALLAYTLVVGGWIRHCYGAMDVAHPWLDPMPFWRRIVYEPTLVLLATCPVLYVIMMWMGLTFYLFATSGMGRP